MHTIIVNPAAGRGKAVNAALKAAELLKSQGAEYQLVYTQYPKHAGELARRAAQEGCRSILSVGGDGTLQEVVSGCVHEDVTVGAIPGGTGNDFIRALSIKNDVELATKIVLEGHSRRVDVGIFAENAILNVAGCGFDVEVLQYARRFRKVLGKLGYVAGAVCTIFTHGYRPLTVRLDDEEFTCEPLMVTAANGNFFGGGMRLAPNAEVDDGLFDVCVIDRVPRYVIPLLLPSFINGSYIKTKYVRTYRSSKVELIRENMDLNVDGEIIRTSAARIALEKQALSFYAPQG
ncbi:diacylglycerol/lipid kinase family protein [Gehongia tenuis]|uniref:Diacylglycerol kinase family lipid kinase n=1 Tax=Gehongia tenuis TaxID=2763655 RepID=A0A926D5G3_9FIRM|nr:diacylglycerol kinase family protein [Gehongia tenuis]MBC8532088.1 diacylglycerol kinase family lipid kinase [Gehongia tenuis]